MAGKNPTLPPTGPYAAHDAAARRNRRKLEASAYGEGCVLGHNKAGEWLQNPHRSDPRFGGTLQFVIIDMADRMAKADDELERARIQGEIVGFCYAVECPVHAERCRSVVAETGRNKGNVLPFKRPG